MADTLIELAELVEKATGPDRELDAEIAISALGCEREGTDLWGHGEWYSIREPDYYDLAGKVSELPYFTVSLNAAMSLVPEGWWIQHVGQVVNPVCWRARVERNLADQETGVSSIGLFADTPALALCAAALRARAAMKVEA